MASAARNFGVVQYLALARWGRWGEVAFIYRPRSLKFGAEKNLKTLNLGKSCQGTKR